MSAIRALTLGLALHALTAAAAAQGSRTAASVPIRTAASVPAMPARAAAETVGRDARRMNSLTGTGPWTFCGALGASCQFAGRRDVRLVSGETVVLRGEVFGQLRCAVDAFGAPDMTPPAGARCEYGPLALRTLANPRPAGSPLPATVQVALGATGWGSGRSRRGDTDSPLSVGEGIFRTSCQLAGIQFSDPVGNPARVGPVPLSVFFGNTAFAAATVTPAARTTGNSTCRGGTLDRSAYYLPAVVDTQSGEVQVPGDGVFHLGTGLNVDPASLHAVPRGLVMLAGDMTARRLQRYITEWTCRTRWVQNDGTIPACPVGDAVRLSVHFPQCWDGVHLDSPNHRSHMAYAVYLGGPQRSSCPSTHPVVLPQLTQVVEYEVRAGASPHNWRLATDNYPRSTRGGLSAHAYWVNGWDPATMNAIVSECLVRGVDCGLGLIGRGVELF
ncbi:MAG: DUF1996 domain-containing protein [Gemmatimonadaceae bacterium]|nr:DUF1996 domain-containing protein [Gemmatimonadaceae bacterium]